MVAYCIISNICITMYYIVRTIINISMPKDMARDIKREVKAGGFSSVSEFIRAAIRVYRREQLVLEVGKAEREFAEGKAIKLKSLADLD